MDIYSERVFRVFTTVVVGLIVLWAVLDITETVLRIAMKPRPIVENQTGAWLKEFDTPEVWACMDSLSYLGFIQPPPGSIPPRLRKILDDNPQLAWRMYKEAFDLWMSNPDSARAWTQRYGYPMDPQEALALIDSLRALGLVRVGDIGEY